MGTKDLLPGCGASVGGRHAGFYLTVPAAAIVHRPVRSLSALSSSIGVVGCLL